MVYSACDSGVDTLDDRIDTPTNDAGILAVVYPDLEDALKEYFEDVHDAVINNPECYQTQIEDSDLDDVIEKVDALLEPMGEDLDHTNFTDRLLLDDEEAGIDWTRMDSVAVQELQDAREGLNDDYLANCPELEDFIEDAEELQEEYAEDISDMGQDKFVEWVLEFTIGGQETDNCIDKCLSDFASAVATATTLQVLGIEVCAAIGAAIGTGISPIGGALIGAGCILAVEAVYDKSRDDAQDEASDCIMACLAAGKPYDNRDEKWH